MNMETTMRLRESVAEEVRALLARRRMSGVALAAEIQRSDMYVSRRLRGETAFDLDDLEKIAGVLRVNVADLLPRRDLIGSYGKLPHLDTVPPPFGHHTIGGDKPVKVKGRDRPPGPRGTTRPKSDRPHITRPADLSGGNLALGVLG